MRKDISQPFSYSLFLISYFLFLYSMLPDYPHKIFSDRRSQFSLLMETLAMDTPIP
jgi:hypothetical protein